MYNVYVASYFGAIDTLYVGLCLYCGCYLDYLKENLTHMNNEFKQLVLMQNYICVLKSINVIMMKENSSARANIVLSPSHDERCIEALQSIGVSFKKNV